MIGDPVIRVTPMSFGLEFRRKARETDDAYPEEMSPSRQWLIIMKTRGNLCSSKRQSAGTVDPGRLSKPSLIRQDRILRTRLLRAYAESGD